MHGRARVSSRNPSAFATCDRCGFLYNRQDLQWQYDWRGPRLENLRILVCRQCLDIPNEQLRPRVLSADPLPINNPRPENYQSDDNTWLTIEGSTFVILAEAATPTYGGQLLVLGIATNNEI